MEMVCLMNLSLDKDCYSTVSLLKSNVQKTKSNKEQGTRFKEQETRMKSEF